MLITYTIYCLYSRREKIIFYVGVTGKPLSIRKYAHLNDALLWNGLNPNKNATIISLGGKFNIKIIEKTPSRLDSYKIESLYINKYINEGHPLTNISKNIKYKYGGRYILNKYSKNNKK